VSTSQPNDDVHIHPNAECRRGNLRLAFQTVDPEIVARADRTFVGAEDLANRAVDRLRIDCSGGDLRSQWMDTYEQLGGEVHVLCGERVAPLRADHTIAQLADRVFASRHGDRRLTLDNEDRELRTEWMDLYVEFGGRITILCDPEREAAIGLRPESR
jgi:hypothetical protein